MDKARALVKYSAETLHTEGNIRHLHYAQAIKWRFIHLYAIVDYDDCCFVLASFHAITKSLEKRIIKEPINSMTLIIGATKLTLSHSLSFVII